MSTSISVQKNALRQEFLAARRSMTEADRRRESSVLCERLAAHPTVQTAQDVHVYWPRAQRGEPDLRPLIDTWLAEGRRVWLPVVDGRQLRAGRYAGLRSLHASPMGMLEPAASPHFRAGELDVVIVPALAVDEAGFRLGYGGGFYDRWLRDVHAETVCPIFGSAYVPALPHSAHDIPMKHVITSA